MHSPFIRTCQMLLYAASMAALAHSAAWAGWWNRDVANSTARAGSYGIEGAEGAFLVRRSG